MVEERHMGGEALEGRGKRLRAGQTGSDCRRCGVSQCGESREGNADVMHAKLESTEDSPDGMAKTY